MVGKVWLVGAGASDAELLTLKAKHLIEQADVVIYDRLVGQGILTMIPDSAETIDVGKRAGNHTMLQEDINKLILLKAQQCKNVVRLKGGDPFLFGRGREELELLIKNNIPYEIVPGITSALAVPAYSGIPVTDRDYSSSVHIITGHKRNNEEYDIDFEALVKTKGTLVFLMGVSALKDICNGLLNAGMNKDTPICIIQKGTTSKQKRILFTIGNLEAQISNTKIETPAIIVVGEVCSLSEKFKWYEKLPLFGCKIIVTRPKELISTISNKLREQGAEVLELPSIKIVPIENNESLNEAFENLETFDWTVFTSPTGVNIFFEAMKRNKVDIRKLFNSKIAAIGEGTKNALLAKGIYIDLIPEIYDGEHLGKALSDVCKDGDKILIPRARNGNPELIEQIIKNHKVEIFDIPTYDTIYECSRIIDEKLEFENNNIDFIIFTSASTVKGFVNSTKGLDYTTVKAICIGKHTKEVADSYKMITYMSQAATVDSIVELITSLHQN